MPIDSSFVAGNGDKPLIEVQCKGGMKNLFSKEVSSIVLVKIKETAQANLGKAVTNAVITVSVYFNNSSRSD